MSRRTADTRPRALGYRKPREPRPVDPQAPIEEQYDEWLENVHEQYNWLHERGVMQALKAAEEAGVNGVREQLYDMTREMEARLPARFPGESAAIYRHAARLLAEVSLAMALVENGAFNGDPDVTPVKG